MTHRLTSIVTHQGDNGETNLANGTIIPKYSLRIEALGDIDELNSAIGLVMVYIDNQDIKDKLLIIQHDLFDLGAELSLPEKTFIQVEKILQLEQWLTAINAKLAPLEEFILPGGDIASAHCHLARCICRRAERHLWALHNTETLSLYSLQYINRLSDLLFVFARVIAKQTTYWNKNL